MTSTRTRTTIAVAAGFVAGLAAATAGMALAQRGRGQPVPAGPPPVARHEVGGFLRAPRYVQSRVRGTIAPGSRAEWRAACEAGEVALAGGCDPRRGYPLFVWRSLAESADGRAGWSCGVLNEGERPLPEPVVDAWVMCAPTGLP